ncbi:MAG: T9SS type A sorting domain-containing protein [Chitinivibrionales bacterium]|nr:T9SS type A sorting domain-containing protein [Chitinivibrionales bacterium]
MRKTALLLFMFVPVLIFAQTPVYLDITPKTESIVEGDAGTQIVTITLSLDRQISYWKEIDWTTTDNTALASEDYVAANGTVRFVPGDTVETIDITVNGDTKWEMDEDFFVDFTAGAYDPAGSIPITVPDSSDQTIVTILNDDFDISVQVLSDTVDTEGTDPTVPPATTNHHLYFNVSQNPPAGQRLRIRFHFEDGTAVENGTAGDYVAYSGAVTVTDASTLPLRVSNRIRVYQDVLPEDDEVFNTVIDSVWVETLGNTWDWTGGFNIDQGTDGHVLIIDDDEVDVQMEKWTREGTTTVTEVVVEQAYNYRVRVRNLGPSDSANVVVTDQLPEGLTLDPTVTPNITGGGVYDPVTRIITWLIPDLDAGQARAFVVYFTVDADVPEGTEIINTACAEAIHDINPENDCAMSTVVVLRPDVDACADINSTKNVGLAPVMATFESLKPLSAYQWFVDLDKRSIWPKPNYVYQYPIPPAGLGKTYDITQRGPIEETTAVDFIRVYEPGGLGTLKLVQGTPTTREGTWENAVDGDIYWYDGTAEVAQDATGTAWAIFEFVDQSTRLVNKFRLMTDTGLPNFGKQMTQFEVLVSTDGVSYTKVLAEGRSPVHTPCLFHDDWTTYDIAPIEAKFIKLVVKRPFTAKYAAIGELEAWFDAKLADPAKSSLTVVGNTATLVVKDADDNPMTGLTGMDITVFSYNTTPYHGDSHAVVGSLLGEDAANPGTYTANIVNKGYVKASVNGVLLDSGLAIKAADIEAQQAVEKPVTAEIPTSFALQQNYPNPFNPMTNISYDLPEESNVTIRIYDMTGKEVATLVNGSQAAGTHTAVWNANEIPSGVYFYQIHAGSFNATKKMLLLK